LESNLSGDAFVAWCWKAGGSNVSNTDGSITSTVRANDTYGFSIVSYEGNGSASQTVGHGLGSAPSSWFVIIKNRTSGSTDWPTFHSSISSGRLKLNTTDDDFGNYPITFNTDTITLPSVSDLAWSSSSNNYIAYCWAEKSGYSKFGDYDGNGSLTAGPTITCGFKPALVIIKRTDGTKGWLIFDNTRDTANPNTKHLLADTNGTEVDSSNKTIDFNSNGFQIKSNQNELNNSSGNYLYAAFADTREAAFWLDQSGNDNDWQPNNLDHNDTVADSPTDNFATLNPLSSSSSVTLSDGNLKGNRSTADWESAISTIGISSGKFYAEITWNSGTYLIVGASPESELATIDNQYYGYSSGSFGYGWDGKRRNNASTATYGDAFATGDVIGIAVDMDNGYVYFSKNGVYQNSGDPNSGSSGTGGLNIGTSETVFVGISLYSSTATINFGQQPFKYDPPE